MNNPFKSNRANRKQLMLRLKLICIMLLVIPCLANAENQETVVLFEMSIFNLQNIEITTAGKTEEKIKDIPASVLVVTRKDIETYGYTTLTEILENVPGLYNIYSYNGAPGNFGIRGFWNPFSQNSNIAFLVNGVKQINDDNQSNPMTQITVPVEAIDRIEIIKGPMSVIYGSGASFGVINIITNEITNNNDVSLAAVTYGSRDTKKAVIRLSQHTENLKIVFNAAEYRTDGVDNKFSEMISPANFPAQIPSNYSTDGLLEHNNQYIGISGSYKNLYFDAALNNTDVDYYAVSPSLRSGNERQSENTSIMLGYKETINNWFSYDTYLAYFDNYRQNTLDIFDPTAFGTRTVNYTSWEAEFVATFKPSTHWNIIAGINQRTMQDNSEAFNIPASQSDPINNVRARNAMVNRDNRTTQSIFTQATYSPDKNLTLVAGLRLENNPSYTISGTRIIDTPAEFNFETKVKSHDTLLPRIAAIYHFNQHNTLKFLYGKAAKIVDDNSNKPETTKTTELNYIYTQEKYSVSSSLFYNELEDLFIENIIFDSAGFSIEKARGGEVTTKGIEILAQGFLYKNTFGEINYTYQQSDDELNNSDAAYSPSTIVQGKLSFQQRLNTYSLLTRYVSSISPSFNASSGTNLNNVPFKLGETIGSYTVFDLNYRRDKLFGNAYFNLKLGNIFDEEIRYPNNPGFNLLLDKGTIGYERSVYATFGLKF